VPKTFAVCTIRSTPSTAHHCIAWAKSYLFPCVLAPRLSLARARSPRTETDRCAARPHTVSCSAPTTRPISKSSTTPRRTARTSTRSRTCGTRPSRCESCGRRSTSRVRRGASLTRCVRFLSSLSDLVLLPRLEQGLTRRLTHAGLHRRYRAPAQDGGHVGAPQAAAPAQLGRAVGARTRRRGGRGAQGDRPGRRACRSCGRRERQGRR